MTNAACGDYDLRVRRFFVSLGLLVGHGAEHLYLALGKGVVPEANLGDADFLLLAVVINKEEEALRQPPVQFVGPDASAHFFAVDIDEAEKFVDDEDVIAKEKTSSKKKSLPDAQKEKKE